MCAKTCVCVSTGCSNETHACTDKTGSDFGTVPDACILARFKSQHHHTPCFKTVLFQKRFCMHGIVHGSNMHIGSHVTMRLSLAVCSLILCLCARLHRRRHRLTLASLPLQANSAWERLFQSKDDDGLIHVTGNNFMYGCVFVCMCMHECMYVCMC